MERKGSGFGEDKNADLLKAEIKTASRLLSKAEKLDILKSYGKTKNKVYFRE